MNMMITGQSIIYSNDGTHSSLYGINYVAAISLSCKIFSCELQEVEQLILQNAKIKENLSAGKRDRFLLLTDEQAPSLKLAEGRCRRQRPEAVTRP